MSDLSSINKVFERTQNIFLIKQHEGTKIINWMFLYRNERSMKEDICHRNLNIQSFLFPFLSYKILLILIYQVTNKHFCQYIVSNFKYLLKMPETLKICSLH
jgi:hypothetical protein